MQPLAVPATVAICARPFRMELRGELSRAVVIVSRVCVDPVVVWACLFSSRTNLDAKERQLLVTEQPLWR